MNQESLLPEFGTELLPPELINILQDYLDYKSIQIPSKHSLTESANIENRLTEKESDNINDSETINESSAELIPISIKSITETNIFLDSNICDRYYEENFANGCGCVKRCDEKFPRDIAFESHLNSIDLDRYCPTHVNHQHILLLGAMNAMVKSPQVKDKDVLKAMFKFRGVDVCRRFFQFVFGCGEKRTKNITKQFLNQGIKPIQHRNGYKIKSLIPMDSHHQRQSALMFIINYASQNALQLPGRYMVKPNQNIDLYLLPNKINITRRYIYNKYVQACEDQSYETISYALWIELWDLNYPNIMTINDRHEMCYQCRLHQTRMKKLVNDEMGKLELSRSLINHIENIRFEQNYYNDLIQQCRSGYETLLKRTDIESGIRQAIVSAGSMHCTLDWYSTISLPFVDTNSNRHLSLYLKSGYKVALFGISVEPLRKFILYIIPEFICHQLDLLPNLTISLIHHFFSIAQLPREKINIHVANGSLDQMKNCMLIPYFMWRTLIGMHDHVGISFLPSGHVRCWNDMIMATFRKKLRNCTVNSLDDVRLIAEHCIATTTTTTMTTAIQSDTVENKLIQAILVGTDDEQLQIPLYDWKKRFEMIRQLKQQVINDNLHFDISIDTPGLIQCRKNVKSEFVQYRLIDNENMSLVQNNSLPNKLILEPLPTERRFYLYENVREHFTDNRCHKLWDCDCDTLESMRQKQPKRKLNKEIAKDEKKSKIQRPRCSYCKQIGHRESAFGKVQCPKKRSDSELLAVDDQVQFDETQSGIVTEQSDEINIQSTSSPICDEIRSTIINETFNEDDFEQLFN